MGTYLSAPVTDKQEESGQALDCPDSPVAWGVVDMQGWRKSMEDAHVAVAGVPIRRAKRSRGISGISPNRTAKVFGVFDGHGGPEVARFCQLYLVSVLTQQATWALEQDEDEDDQEQCNDADITNAAEQQQEEKETKEDDPTSLSAGVEETKDTAASDDSDASHDNNNGDDDEQLPKSPAQSNVGRALKATFHALDRMIDSIAKREELVRLRAVKPALGERRTAENIPAPQPHDPRPLSPTPESQQPHASFASASVAGSQEKVDAPFDEVTDSSSSSSSENQNNNNNNNSDVTAETKQVELIASSSNALVVVNNDDFTTEKKDDDSDAVAGKEEASKLDQDLMNDDSDESSSDTEDLVNDENHPAPADHPFIVSSLEEEEDGTDADTEDESSGNMSLMLRRLLQLSQQVQSAAGSATNTESITKPVQPQMAAPPPPPPPHLLQHAMLDGTLNGDNNNNTTTIISTSSSSSSSLEDGPPTANTTTAPASVLQNGRRICNLPDHAIHAGATAVVAVLVGRRLTVANAGDSRAVLCRAGIALPLSLDHKPSQPTESHRIATAGGFINHFGRVNGNLNLSRSLGDLKYKQVAGLTAAQQMITAEPDLVQVDLLLSSSSAKQKNDKTTTTTTNGDSSTPKALDDDPSLLMSSSLEHEPEHEECDEFVLLGCDGIWDCMTNQEAVNYVKTRIATQRPTEIIASLLDSILSTDPRTTQGIGGDNMTLLILDLQPHTRSYYHQSSTAATTTMDSSGVVVSPLEGTGFEATSALSTAAATTTTQHGASTPLEQDTQQLMHNS